MSPKVVGAGRPWKRFLGRKALLVTLLLLGSAAGFALWQWPAFRVSREARNAFATANFVKAEAAARRWVALRPHSIDAQLALAKAAIARGHERDVISAMKTARALGCPPEPLAVLRAYEEARDGRSAEARPALERAFLASTSPDPMLYETLARVYMDLYEFKHAGAVLERWTAEAPRDARPPFWHSIVHRRLAADPSVVERDFREALRREPSLAEARLGLAELLSQGRSYDDASKEYDLYLKTRPDDAAGHVGAGRNDLLLHRDDEALRHFDRALSLDPTNPAAHLEHAKLDLRRGSVDEALAHLDEALRRTPTDPIVRYNRSLALKRLGRTEESLKEHAEFQRLQADQVAVSELQKRLEEAPRDTDAQVELARWMFSHGYEAEGLQWSKKILVDSPGLPEVCQLLADYHRSKGREDLASSYLAQKRGNARDPGPSTRRKP